MQDCCGCWVSPFPFSCSCGRWVGCIRPSRIVWQRMNGIFYLVGLIVLALHRRVCRWLAALIRTFRPLAPAEIYPNLGERQHEYGHGRPGMARK